MAGYEYCRQDDPSLNEKEAWPKTIFPEAEFTYFREGGCLICSLTVLLLHHGIKERDGEERFTPWVLNQKLIACGAFTPTADLELTKLQNLYPLRYAGSEPYSRSALRRVHENGSPCLITVPGIRSYRHFTTLLRMTSSDAVVFDPLYGEKKLSEYRQVCEIREFKNIN